jgi:hypothetical protein
VGIPLNCLVESGCLGRSDAAHLILIVSQREPSVEVYRRTARGWVVTRAVLGSMAVTDEIRIDIDALYRAAEGL